MWRSGWEWPWWQLARGTSGTESPLFVGGLEACSRRRDRSGELRGQCQRCHSTLPAATALLRRLAHLGGSKPGTPERVGK